MLRIDDAYLQRAAAAIPRHSILLIEDIDCAFHNREDDEDSTSPLSPTQASHRSDPFPLESREVGVTLSGLLNVIDGVGSEDSILFFATVSLYCITSIPSPRNVLNVFRPTTSTSSIQLFYVLAVSIGRSSTVLPRRNKQPPSSYESFPSAGLTRIRPTTGLRRRSTKRPSPLIFRCLRRSSAPSSPRMNSRPRNFSRFCLRINPALPMPSRRPKIGSQSSER